MTNNKPIKKYTHNQFSDDWRTAAQTTPRMITAHEYWKIQIKKLPEQALKYLLECGLSTGFTVKLVKIELKRRRTRLGALLRGEGPTSS